jgi:hypothetical protein
LLGNVPKIDLASGPMTAGMALVGMVGGRGPAAGPEAGTPSERDPRFRSTGYRFGKVSSASPGTLLKMPSLETRGRQDAGR